MELVERRLRELDDGLDGRIVEVVLMRDDEALVFSIEPGRVRHIPVRDVFEGHDELGLDVVVGELLILTTRLGSLGSCSAGLTGFSGRA